MICYFSSKYWLKGTSAILRSIRTSLSVALALVVIAGAFSLPASSHGRRPRTVNVLNYGADRTGKSDSINAFKKALAAAPDGTIYIPAGTYICSAPIKLVNQSAYGVGSTSMVIATFSQYNGGLFMPTGRCSISDLAISGNNSGGGQGFWIEKTAGPISIHSVLAKGPFYFNFWLKGASHVTIANCTIANTTQDATAGPGDILIDGCSSVLISNDAFTSDNAQPSLSPIIAFPLSGNASTNLTVSGCSFQTQAVQASNINLTSVTGINIIHNTFSYPMYQGTPTAYQGSPGGIILNGSAPSLGSSGPISNARITNNTFTNLQPLLYNQGNAPIIVTGSPNGQAASVKNVVISNNVISEYPAVEFDGCNLCCGVYVGGTAGGVQNVTISQNTMTGTTNGIWIDDTQNASITNNTVSNSYGLGITSGPSCTGNLVISKNNLSNCGLADPTNTIVKNLGISTQAVIDLQSAAKVTSVVVQDNKYGAQPNNLKYYIYCAFLKAISKLSGNTEGTVLPNYGPL